MTNKQPRPSENAGEFDIQQDDVFGRVASRYDFLCDLFSLGTGIGCPRFQRDFFRAPNTRYRGDPHRKKARSYGI